jgi:thioesterase domain-containing protein
MTGHPSPGGATLAGGLPDLVVALRGGSGSPPLFCLHPVSGSAYAYRGLAGLLRADQPVYGFEAPGFDNDRAPVACLPRLADEYTSMLRAFAPCPGYRLLGWSLGGLMAFEIAKRLHAAGEKVTALILVDAPPPRVRPLPPERDILLRFINDMMGTSEQEAPPRVRDLFESWPDPVDPAAVFPLIEAAEILPGEMDAMLLADQYAVFRALLKGFHSIEVTGSYAGDALHILAGLSPRDEMNWSRALPGVREMTVPGTHYTIWSGKSLVTMSEIVQAALDAT